ncbi:hypothetical protein DFH06DRAFT_1406208 [Mycena polygramma]|nr:hypothetical protein DFH06DRAFT_1406208 [Mycena polygramma]
MYDVWKGLWAGLESDICGPAQSWKEVQRCRGGVLDLSGILPCNQCSDLTVDVDVLKERASRPFENLRVDDLNNRQLRDKLSAAQDDVNTLKLNNVNVKDSLAVAHRKLSDCQEILHFMGTTRIPALHRILANAAEDKWSLNKLREYLKAAAHGKYFARNYTQYEIDLAILLYELGGAGAVHAMNHSMFVLPSLRTIQPHRRQHKITPSVSGLQFTDISKNISETGKGRKDWQRKEADGGGRKEVDTPMIRGCFYKWTLCGHTLSFDELAAERRIDYMTATDQMGGFCLEHLNGLETIKVGKGIETVEAAVEAVKEGKVHIAHEISVGAISHLARTNYGAKPIYMGPTCKKGSWKDMLRTMLTAAEAWKRSPDGEARHGPLFDVASDGCPKRRIAMFIMCMHSEILPGNPLYEFIKNLDGLNRRVGFNNISGDWDYRHDIKRNCTLICSPEGMVVNNVCINRDLLLGWLERLPETDWTETSIHTLLNPKEGQPVETSIRALLNPKDGQNVTRAVKLLSSVAALRKLDSDDFDPSEAAEFEALCALGETLDALLQPFINPDLSLSEQITSLVKFSHLLCGLYIQNGTSFMSNQLYGDYQAMLGVYICLLGDDVLEALFGRSRMIGGHSPNCSVGELRDRFGSAMNLDRLYEEQPEWERKPRRLQLVRDRDVDHLRPKMWRGEVRADSCDLDACWVAGRKAAEAVLRKYDIKMEVSFAERFKRPNTDLMRPFGGKYPAISLEVDRSMVNLSADLANAVDIDPASVTPNNPLLYVDYDAIIAQETAQAVADSEEPHSLFAEIDSDGHLTHKMSSHDSRTSHDRLQRIRGYTIGGKAANIIESPEGEVSNATHFQLGNIFSTLMPYDGSHLGLAVAKCTVIKKCIPGNKPISLSAIPLAELDVESTPYAISGQVLSLVPGSATASEWVWDGEFVFFSVKKPSKSSPDGIARKRNLQFETSSRLVDAIHGNARETDISDVQLEVNSRRERTWSFSDGHLLASFHRLWTRVIGDTTLHNKFPPPYTGVSSGAFPYQAPRSADFPGIIYSLPIAGTAIQITSDNRQNCRLCHKHVKDTDRQMHMGQHVLKALQGVPEADIYDGVSPDHPCGTCGAASNDTCRIRIKSGNADSNCPSAYAFRISAAAQFSDTRPCTNIPIRCALGCEEMHWKYNFPQHFTQRHPSWRQVASAAFLEKLQVSRAEQRAMGIPETKITDWLPIQPRGQKRTADCLQQSPSRRGKENDAPTESLRPAKTIRVGSEINASGKVVLRISAAK